MPGIAEPNMRHRNLSVDRYFLELAEKHRPKYRFAGRTKGDWQAWRGELLPAVKASLGIMPQKVPLNGELLAEWRDDGLIKQRVVFDVEAGLAATGYVFRPEGASGKLPAILCCHGHGGNAEGFWGKDGVMTSRAHAEPGLREKIERHNYDYGVQMAQAGFVTMCIDWRGFGERDDRKKPHFHNLTNDENGDPCNVHYLRASLLGRTVLGMDIHDGMCAVDYLRSEKSNATTTTTASRWHRPASSPSPSTGAASANATIAKNPTSTISPTPKTETPATSTTSAPASSAAPCSAWIFTTACAPSTT